MWILAVLLVEMSHWFGLFAGDLAALHYESSISRLVNHSLVECLFCLLYVKCTWRVSSYASFQLLMLLLQRPNWSSHSASNDIVLLQLLCLAVDLWLRFLVSTRSIIKRAIALTRGRARLFESLGTCGRPFAINLFVCVVITMLVLVLVCFGSVCGYCRAFGVTHIQVRSYSFEIGLGTFLSFLFTCWKVRPSSNHAQVFYLFRFIATVLIDRRLRTGAVGSLRLQVIAVVRFH